jgi:hypothetical protein
MNPAPLGSCFSVGLSALAVLLAAGAPAEAQVEVTPRLGIFRAATGIAQWETYGMTSGGSLERDHVELRQGTAPLTGATVTIWLNSRIAVAVDAWYAPSGVDATTTTTVFADPYATIFIGETSAVTRYGGHLFAGSGRLLLGFPVGSGATTLYVSAGPGILARRSNAWALSAGETDAALVLGGGAGRTLARTLSLRAEISDYVSNFGSSVQNDLFASIGLAVAIRGR